MRLFAIASVLLAGLASAAAAQTPGMTETGKAAVATDLGSGVHGGMSTATDAMSKPGGPGNGIPGGGPASPGTATDDGNFGTGIGAPGMRPANPGTAPRR